MMRLSLAAIVIASGLVATHAGMTAPLITGYEVVADRPILAQVSALALERSVGRTLTTKVIREDVRKIQLLGTVAAVHVGYRDHKGGKKILIKVDSNPVIRRLTLEGVTAVPAKEIFAAFKVKPGQLLNYRVLFADLNKVSQVYAKRGFMWADVMGPQDVHVSKDGDVRVRVREYRLDRVVIKGLGRDYVPLVRSEFLIRPGEMVRREKLLNTLHGIYMQSFIKDVDWKPVFDTARTSVTLVLDIEPDPSLKASVD